MKCLKKIIIPLIALLVVLTFATYSFASEVIANNVATNGVAKGTDSQIQSRIPNIIVCKAQSGGDNYVTIYVKNIGIDTFDSVTCYVQIWNEFGLQYAKANTFNKIFPNVVQKNKFYLKDWTKVTVTNIQAKDGNDYGTLPDFVLEK